MIKSRAIKAMAHQAQSLKHDEKNPRVFDMSDAGTGKTFVRIMSFVKRRAKGGGCALVLAPLSLLRAAWQADCQKFAPQLKVSVANASNREAAFKTDADIYVTNHDAVKWLAKQKPAFFAKFSELIIDEATAFKHHTSGRSKALVKIIKHFEQRKLLTATPTSNSITDIWHQAFILDNGKRLGASFYGFRNHVCTPQQVGRMAQAVKWVDKDGAEEAVFDLLADITVRHRRKDCLDIPETQVYTMPFELTPKQQRAYDDMEEKQLLPILNVLNTLKGGTKQFQVMAVNAAAVVSKLMQICSGAVYDTAGGVSFVDDFRYVATLDLVEERKHPLVFFQWGHQRDYLVAEAERRGLNFAVIDGSTKEGERYAIQQAYQMGKYDVVFAHPQTTAHGFTFTRGTSTIWPSPTHNLEWFRQGNSRQARIGQTEKTEVITMLAPGTREEEVYEGILMGKDVRMSKLLDLFVAGMKDKEFA